MGDEVFIVAIVFGSIITIVFLGILGSVLKAWAKRGSQDITKNQEFLAALREFKEKTDRRLSNIEAIIADEKPAPAQKKKEPAKIENQKSAIEIELEDEQTAEEPNKSSKLRNMLNQ